jgi:allantoin racemase
MIGTSRRTESRHTTARFGGKMTRQKIKIYKILPVRDGLENWGTLHEELVAPLLHDGLEVVQVDLPDAPVTSISSNRDADLVATASTEAAIRAEREGYDAVIMGCLFEPGVSAAKEQVQIPVIGDLEAALHVTSLLARRFSFVLGGSDTRKGDRPLEDMVRQHGFVSKVASIRRINAPSLAFARREDLVAALVEQARAAIEEDAAEAIVGYGGLSLIQELRRSLGIPVVSAIQSTVVLAESLARLGLSQSRRAFEPRE